MEPVVKPGKIANPAKRKSYQNNGKRGKYKRARSRRARRNIKSSARKADIDSGFPCAALLLRWSLGVMFIANALLKWRVYTMPVTVANYPSLRQRLAELERFRAKLQQSEAYLLEAQRLSHTGSFGWRISTGEIFWSEENFRIFQYDPATKPTIDMILQRVHPDDLVHVRQTIERTSSDGTFFDHEYRLLMPDGSVKYVDAAPKVRSRPVR